MVILWVRAPIWDDNEKWLMVAGIVVCGAFPIVRATILSAYYLPISFARQIVGHQWLI